MNIRRFTIAAARSVALGYDLFNVPLAACDA